MLLSQAGTLVPYLLPIIDKVIVTGWYPGALLITNVTALDLMEPSSGYLSLLYKVFILLELRCLLMT